LLALLPLVHPRGRIEGATGARGRIGLLQQLTERRGASLLGRIRPSRPSPLGGQRVRGPPVVQEARGPGGQEARGQEGQEARGPVGQLETTPRPPVRQSLLDRARSRPRLSFLSGHRQPTRPPFTPRRPTRRRQGGQEVRRSQVQEEFRRPSTQETRRPGGTNGLEQNILRSDECDALRTENDLLKQLISSVTGRKPSSSPSAAEQGEGSSPLQALQRLQGQLQLQVGAPQGANLHFDRLKPKTDFEIP